MARYNAHVSYFSRTCRVCQYCQKGHMDFHEALLKTRHFGLNGETVQKCWARFQPEIQGKVVPYTTIMQHVRRHLIPAYEHFKEIQVVRAYHGNKKVVTEDQLRNVLAGEVVSAKSKHEQTLDLYIDEFHKLIQDNQIQITAQSGLQAIKIRAEIDKSNKDRKADIMKAFANRGVKDGDAEHHTNE